MSLAEASEERKAKLLALRRRKAGEEWCNKLTSRRGSDNQTLLKTRNFDPESRTLRKHNKDDDANMTDTVEKDVSGLVETVIAEDEQRRAQELDVFNIAPKRANWDLKREMDKKVVRLERRTQEVIHTLIRQRLAAQNGESDDLVGAMRAQQKAQDSLEDEED
ncbi:mRNA splicing factor [Pleurotus eryngii]|uniref:mRNA splicing factor n=1 Tax=Pleurotus eryngii TaxID=5323 RepID=A0A9P6A5T3_PLEER|nr:mRNA splicing factor [Pleurotus eryngii]